MTHKRILLAAIAAVLLIVVSTPVSAGTLQIQFSGLNLVYSGDSSGGHLCDAGGCIGDWGQPDLSDPLISMNFLVDGVLVGSLTSNIWAAIDLVVTEGILASGGTFSGQGFIFDLLTKNVPSAAWGLAIDAGTFIATYNPGTGTFAFNGSGVVGNGIFTQDLPFGLVIGDPVIWSFSTNNLGTPTTSGGYVTGFAASGTGEVSGIVPEPASLILMGSGLSALAGLLRRKRA